MGSRRLKPPFVFEIKNKDDSAYHLLHLIHLEHCYAFYTVACLNPCDKLIFAFIWVEYCVVWSDCVRNLARHALLAEPPFLLVFDDL